MFKKIILCFSCMLMFMSCDRLSSVPCTADSDSTYVAEQVDAKLNPSFVSPAMLIDYQQSMIEEIETNETFLDMNPALIANVATVCINKNGSVTVKQLIDEYRANQAVYDNLSSSTGPANDTLEPQSVMEEQQLPAVSDSGVKKLKATQIDTVIDGKHVELIRYQKNG